MVWGTSLNTQVVREVCFTQGSRRSKSSDSSFDGKTEDVPHMGNRNA